MSDAFGDVGDFEAPDFTSLPNVIRWCLQTETQISVDLLLRLVGDDTDDDLLQAGYTLEKVRLARLISDQFYILTADWGGYNDVIPPNMKHIFLYVDASADETTPVAVLMTTKDLMPILTIESERDDDGEEE